MKLKVGGYVYNQRHAYVRLYQVTEVGKARAKAIEVGNFPGLVFEVAREISFMLASGKVVGDSSNRVELCNEGLEYWQNWNQQKKNETEEKKTASIAKWQAMLDRAKELNPVFNFVEMEMGLKKLEVKLAAEVSNLLFISVKPCEVHYSDNKVEVDFVAFGRSWHSSRIGFHHNNVVLAVSLEDALYNYIASNLIERKSS